MKKSEKSFYLGTGINYFFAGIALVILYCIPFYILGENSYIRIHDNLDSEVVWRTILARSGKIFSSSGFVPEIMGGIPRHCLPTGYNVVTVLYSFFTPFIAYIINETIVRLLSFIGMYLLLSRHFNDDNDISWAIFGSALCFAILPMYSIYGLTIAGQPLLLYSVLNIYNNKYKIRDYIIIFIFPLYSSLVLSGVFIIAVLILVFLYKLVSDNKFHVPFFLAILLLLLVYIIVENPLFYNMFFNKNYISHRSLWRAGQEQNTLESLNVMFIFLWKGSYHIASKSKLILVMVIIYGFMMLSYRIFKPARIDRNMGIVLKLFFFCVLLSSIVGFYNWSHFAILKNKYTILCEFQFDRFYFLLPCLWYMILFFILRYMEEMRIPTVLIIAIVLLQCWILLSSNNEILGNIRLLSDRIIGSQKTFSMTIGTKPNNICSFRNWYSSKLYDEVAEFLPGSRNDYAIISIGVDPMVAVYNGFRALDSYQNNYPLEYKQKFRKIMAAELDKNKKYKRYFDEWGNRCYIFPANNEDTRYYLDLDMTELSKLGGKYIFSCKEIVNRSNRIKLLKIFSGDMYVNKLYLYENML